MHQNSPDAPRTWQRDRRGCAWILLAELAVLATIVVAIYIHLK